MSFPTKMKQTKIICVWRLNYWETITKMKQKKIFVFGDD